MVLQFTEHARSDLRSIVNYTKINFGSQQAITYVTQLKEQALILTEHPGIGKRRDALIPGLRCFPFKTHVLYYVVQHEVLIVIRVLHRLMEPSKHLRSQKQKQKDTHFVDGSISFAL